LWFAVTFSNAVRHLVKADFGRYPANLNCLKENVKTGPALKSTLRQNRKKRPQSGRFAE
jgi:hypothetical protein